MDSPHDEPPSHARAHPRFRQAVRELSDRLLAIQRPIRVLDAVRWDDEVERRFLLRDGRDLPAVTPDYYYRRPLPFDPTRVLADLAATERAVGDKVGARTAAGQLLVRNARSYANVVRMLAARGTRRFAALSRELYGTTLDRDDPSGGLQSLVDALGGTTVNAHAEDPPAVGCFDARQARDRLSDRLAGYFHGAAAPRVTLSASIASDAAAGRDYLKLHRDASFTPRDLDLLEVHEGWVHLGTTTNAEAQDALTCLRKPPPAATRTQEGLAVLTEFLAGVSHPARVRRLRNRLRAVALAEQGADFREVFRFFRDAGDLPPDAYRHAVRIFRGSLPAGCGPFTKDLSYGLGLLEVRRIVESAAALGRSRTVALLFAGKTAAADLPLLEDLFNEGLLKAPRFLPPPYRDAAALREHLTRFRQRLPLHALQPSLRFR